MLTIHLIFSLHISLKS